MSSPGTALLLTILRRRWRQIGGGSLFMMGHQTGESLVPVAVGYFIDTAVTSGEYQDLLPGVIILAVVFAGLSNSWRFGAGLLQRAVKGAEHDLRVDVTRRVLDPAGGVSGRLTGELLSIATTDAERTSRIVSVIATAAGAAAALIVTTIVLLRISIPLGLLVLIGSIPLIGLMQFLGRTLERHSGAEQAGAARAAGIANDLVSGLRILKGIGAEDAAIERYRQASRSSLQATVRAARTQAAYQGLTLALTGSFLALVAYIGGRLAASDQISVGDLIAALGLSQFLIGPLHRLTAVGAILARSRASATRVANLLERSGDAVATDSTRSMPVAGEITFDGVSIRTLENISFTIEPGESVGIAAADPADALALLDCLTGDVPLTAGTVLLDGEPLTALAAEDRHASVVVAPHDSYLFAQTLRENVQAAAPDPDVLWAIEAAAADEVAANLPNGQETLLSEGGRSLSGGQRQRVALARALATIAPVLVLHDPTTAVDSVTEARIADGIRTSRRGRTTLLLTTSPVLLAVTDRVIFVNDGRVESQAPHATMMEAHSAYHELVVS